MLVFLLAALLPAGGATPAATPTPTTVLHEIGHVRAVTTFCKAFTTHFDNAARSLIANDEDISYVDFTLGNIQPHYKVKAGADLLLADDRIKLIAFTKEIFARMAALQTEINSLRQAAALTTDPEQAKAARLAAQDLQTTYNHQRQLAVDTQSVIAVMMEDATAEKTPHTQAPMPAIAGRADLDLHGDHDPEAMKDVRNIMKFEQQRDRIAVAEESAVTTAEIVASKC